MNTESPEAQCNRAKLLVWWILWGSILGGLLLIYLVLGRTQPLPKNVAAEKMFTGLVGLIPMVVSVVVRWLVLPRASDMNRALVIFIFGLATAEACGILGIFLGGPYRDDLFLLGMFGVVQYVPFFAKNYIEPKVSGFIPNN